MISADFEKNFNSWRAEARRLLKLQVSPGLINWSLSTGSLFDRLPDEANKISKTKVRKYTVSKDTLKILKTLSYAGGDGCWDLMYRIIYRLTYENPSLLSISIDKDVRQIQLLTKSIRRDIHKLHAFVRFKKIIVNEKETYVAWHRPEHRILRPGSPFFARRFGDKPWSIFSPDESSHWDLKKLTFGEGMSQSEFDVGDKVEDLWKSYYKSIFNPARIKVKMMKTEMSPKYWSTMPEAALISELIREAPSKLQVMAANRNKAALVNPEWSYKTLKEKANHCTSCPIASKATQTVFGVGPTDAKIMIVGEQPGDQEDLLGKPFQGPAGKLLRKILVDLNIDDQSLYLTNAVKHFKWRPKGELRAHQKPTGAEMHACKPWLEQEIKKIKPKVIIALGLTAATSIIGLRPKISEVRGKFFTDLKCAPKVMVTWHPSAILRSPNEDIKKLRAQQLAEDLLKSCK